MVPPESSQSGLLEKVLAEYMNRLDRGEAVDRDQILAQHPELAEDLQSYFAGGDEVERLGWAGIGQMPTLRRPRPAATETTPAEPGRPSVGDYDLLEQIGRGGMGIIYKAQQRSLHRLVALKMIRTDRLASFADRLRFHSEAEAVASLDHPHIVPIYEVGVHEGQPFYSMKLVEGGSLAQHLPRFAADPRAGAGLLATVARAVHHAHQRGILHRDLKPANLLIDAEGHPHVTDFGLAKRLGPQRGEASITQQGAIVGTPNYMAPEQATGREGVSTATDVYSLGAILYEMLTGRPPFSAETPLETLRLLVEENPLPPRSVNNRVDRDLETICLKCLQKEPQQRYRGAEALADDLERWLQGKPIRARPISRARRALKWARRQPHLAALAALLVLALVGGFVGVCWQWLRAEAENRRAKEHAEAERHAHYARAIPLAQARWLAGNAGAAEQVLDETDADLRGWEWHYLRRLFRVRQMATLHGHEAGVLAVVFSPDGWRVASGDAHGVVKVWDRRTLKAVLTLPGHTDEVAAMAFNADGTYLASGSADGSVRIWDAATGEAVATFEAHAGGVTGLAFDPTPPDAAGQPAGKGRPVWRLASTGKGKPRGELKCWDAASGKLLGGRTHDFPFTALAYSPDGKQLVTASEVTGDVTGRDVATLAPVRTYLTYKGLAEQQVFPWSNSVAFSADSSLVAAASSLGVVRVWDAATTEGSFSTLTATGAGVSGLAFAGPDGRILAAATTDNTIQAWYTKSHKHAFTLRGHTRAVQALASSPDGRWLASGSLDKTVKLWDLSQRDDDLTLRVPSQVTSFAFTPDGSRLASAAPDQSLRIWDVATGKAALILKNLPEAVNGLAFSPDGALACAGAKGTVQLLDPATGENLAALPGHTGPVHAVAFTPDGATLASAGADGSVRLWDVASGRERRCLQGAAAVQAVAFNHDGSRLAVADADGIARVWETDTGQEALALRDHDGPVHAVAFSLDGRRLATAGKDEAIRIWDATTGKLLRKLHGHGGAVRGLAYGPGGRLASVGDDRAVRVWDAEGHELLALWGHTGVLRAVAFSGNGHLLASAGDDGTVKVWDGTPLKGP